MIEAGLYKAKAVETGSYTNLKIGDYVEGYYVKCRNTHYILQQYNDMGYDERWEAHEWIEVDIKTLEMISPAASPVSDAVDANGKTWQEVLRFMRDNDLFDDKYDSKNLNFIYAFQMGFKSASPTPTNVQEQGQDELWEDFFITWSEVYHESPTVAREQSIKEMQSKYTITKKQ